MSKEYKECYVAFLDILGFKNLIMKEECGYIYDVFQRIRVGSQTQFKLNNELVAAFSAVKHYVMSDSVVLYVEVSVKDSFFALVRTCQILQMSLLGMSSPILLRGGITRGTIFSENEVIYGKGLVNAYLLEGSVADNPRIIFTKQTLDDGRTNYDKIKPGIDSLAFYKDFDELYSVNFMSLEFFSDFEFSALYLDNILNFCQKNIDAETNDRVRSKFLWLKKVALQLAKSKIGLLNLTDTGKTVVEKWNV